MYAGTVRRYEATALGKPGALTFVDNGRPVYPPPLLDEEEQTPPLLNLTKVLPVCVGPLLCFAAPAMRCIVVRDSNTQHNDNAIV